MKVLTLFQFLCNTFLVVDFSLEWTAIAAASSSSSSSAPPELHKKYAKVHLSKKSDHHDSLRYRRRTSNADDAVTYDDAVTEQSGDDDGGITDDYEDSSNSTSSGAKNTFQRCWASYKHSRNNTNINGTLYYDDDVVYYFADNDYGMMGYYQFDGRKSFYEYQTEFTNIVNHNLPMGCSITEDEALDIFAIICCITLVLFACLVSMCWKTRKTKEYSEDPLKNSKYRLMLEKEFGVIV